MPDYVELHAHSNLSLLDGASTPEMLLKQAASLNMKALALTDHDNVYGAVQFDKAARAMGIQAVFGAELTLVGGYHLTLLVEDEQGWNNLCWLISQARHNAPKGSAALPPQALEEHTAGLIALSGCAHGEVPAALLRGDWHAARTAAEHLRDLFGVERFWLELQHHRLPENTAQIDKLVTLARQIGVGYVATNNVHYATRASHRLQDVLVCIRHGQTLDSAGALLRPNSEYFLKSASQMAALFAAYADALTNTLRIAERCNFALHYGLQDLPTFPTLPGLDADAYLDKLCQDALPHFFVEVPDKARSMLAHELGMIRRMGLANYFLIVWDVMRFSREQGIRCQGRGSAANSLVAYLLGISPINPLAHDLVFERFLSDERKAAPDIDIDFAADRREEVIQYMYERYGHDHAAMACTLVTFRTRSAIREVGKALGLPPELLEQQATSHHYRQNGELAVKPEANRATNGPLWQEFDDLCQQIKGFPRHLGIHNGGMVIMGSPLVQRVPTEPATMADRVVIQWDKESLEAAGLIKIDILGLRMLSVVADTAYASTTTSGPVDLDRLTFDDPAVYQMLVEADSIGVFQVESHAQAQVLPRLQPRQFKDLIVTISLIRPGPIQGQMVNPYLRRRMGEEPVRYDHPLLEPALADTLGIILFQEQAIRVGHDLGGLTLGEAELLRRALGKNNEEAIARFQAAFMEGATKNGASPAVAAQVFGQLRAFGSYSFPKSHAAAFAVLVYQSAWLKYYRPLEYFMGLLNHQPMGFWSPAVLVGDARRHGILVLPVDINRSQGKCSIEGESIRLGFNYVKGLGEQHIAHLESCRQEGEFADLTDFCRRTQLPRKLIENLILVGGMDSWGIPRRELLWQLGQVEEADTALDLRFAQEPVELPGFSRVESLYAEYAILGLSTGDHVMALYGPTLVKAGVLNSRELGLQQNYAVVRVAGQVVMHQSPPTAKGHHFLAIEDVEGIINVIVRPQVYEEYAQVIRESPLLVIEGMVQRKGDIVNLIAQRISKLSI